MRLKDKATLITGAGAGIGKAIAIKFAGEGARLVINDIDNRVRNFSFFSFTRIFLEISYDIFSKFARTAGVRG